MASDPAILKEQADYYAARLAEHGPTPRGVDWNGAESQALRHRQFLRLLDDPTGSVLDLGCGHGDFFAYLRAHGHEGAFTGWDLAPAMIAAARAAHPAASWHVGAEPDGACDYAVASGVLNVKGARPDAEWAAHVDAVLGVLARSGRRGFGFNMLSLWSDAGKRRPDLFYADPPAVLAQCRARFGRHVALLADYGLWEFTVLVRHG